jgi:hypothetical protein
MPLFCIYDPDTIEVALSDQGRKLGHSVRNGTTRLSQRDQLIEDWDELVYRFSWRQRPNNAVGRTE